MVEMRDADGRAVVGGRAAVGGRRRHDVHVRLHALVREYARSLVSDGVHFSRCTIADNVKPLAFLAPADAGRGYGGLADDRDGLLAPGDGETSTCARRSHHVLEVGPFQEERLTKASPHL